MFDFLGDIELDNETVYAAILAVLGGLIAFWMMNRQENLSSMWALFSGIGTMVVSFILVKFMWSRG